MAIAPYSLSTKSANRPQRIILFTSKGGYGHMAVCATLKDILKDYDVTIVNPFEELLSSYDPVKQITCGKLDGEKLYDKMLQGGWIRTLNLLIRRPAMAFIHNRRKHIEKRMYRFLQQEQPDLLISTVPLINYPISIAAQQNNVPFLLITIDADLTHWLLDLDKCTHRRFALTVGTRTPRIADQLRRTGTPAFPIHEIGSPLRPDFLEPKNKEAILARWTLPANKPIIMLWRGGSGSDQLIRYVRTLLTIDIPLHLLVCIGKNERLITRLKRLERDGPVSFSIIPFTQRISDLMAVADILVTQPTPIGCNEAIHMGIPILIDSSIPMIFWERATIDLITLYGSGKIFKRMRDLNPLIKRYLSKRRTMVNNDKSTPSFEASVKQIVQEMMLLPGKPCPGLPLDARRTAPDRPRFASAKLEERIPCG
jgi:processive 1,2-diacylglycerol beta-glucosyltransferase